MLCITHLEFTALNLELTEPFGIATGAQHLAENVLVTLTLSDGSVGHGEAAPFPAVNGETQADALATLNEAKDTLIGQDAARWRVLCDLCFSLAGQTPSALCALETAILDAFCKHHQLSLWNFWGGRDAALQTDITVPTGDAGHAARGAGRAAAQGFTTLKVKVGGTNLDHDARRLLQIGTAAPNCSLILDANGGYSAPEAVQLIQQVGALKPRILLFEQPTPKNDFEGLREVAAKTGVVVAADESASDTAAVARLIRERAADVINLKTMKSGVLQAARMAEMARGAGLKLMIGGMVESQLSMSASACLAGGLGGFSFVDLDTPLFFKDAPFSGGFEQRGPHLNLAAITLGHGVSPRNTKHRS